MNKWMKWMKWMKWNEMNERMNEWMNEWMKERGREKEGPKMRACVMAALCGSEDTDTAKSYGRRKRHTSGRSSGVARVRLCECLCFGSLSSFRVAVYFCFLACAWAWACVWGVRATCVGWWGVLLRAPLYIKLFFAFCSLFCSIITIAIQLALTSEEFDPRF